MATKNIYIKDSDLSLVERAEQELGESLSAIFADCLRAKLGPERPSEVGRIKVEVGDPPITKVFEGRWLFGNPSHNFGIEAVDDEDGVERAAGWLYSAAQTKKGRIVIYAWKNGDGTGEMDVFDSFDDLKDALDSNDDPRYASNVIAEVASSLKIPFEFEFDI